MKRVLFIDHHAELGGGEIFLLEILKRLDRNTFDPLVVLGDNGPFEKALKGCGINVEIMPVPAYFRSLKREPSKKRQFFSWVKSALTIPKLIRKTEHIIERNNIDIVFLNSIKSAVYGVPASRRCKKKIAWMLHDCLNREFYSRYVIRQVIKLSKSVDKMICVSNTVKNYFIDAGGDKEKVMVVYDGVDLERFSPTLDGLNIKNAFGLGDYKVVTIIGRLEPWKGQRVFIEAAGLILKERDDIRFLMVGSPIFGFYEYEEECKELVKQKGLEERIIFTGFRDDIPQIIAASSVIVHASVRPEPFGRDIIEAMACGKPVVSTNIGGPKEILTPDLGILIEPDRADLLSEGILGLLSDEELSKTFGLKARKRAESFFDIRDISRRIEEIILGLEKEK